MKEYLTKHFPNLTLKRPLFYSSAIGIRFEIGPSNISLWEDFDRKEINEKYFAEASQRAKSIFEQIFESEDELTLVYQKFSDGRQKIKKRFYLFNQIRNLETKKITHTDVKGLYDDDNDFQDPKCYCWKRVEIEVKTKDIDYENILDALINMDFSIRGRSLQGDCFFINKTKNLILNLYDDRGMDVIASKKETLIELYSKYNHWILDYDRKKIDALFK